MYPRSSTSLIHTIFYTSNLQCKFMRWIRYCYGSGRCLPVMQHNAGFAHSLSTNQMFPSSANYNHNLSALENKKQLSGSGV